ncbi:hypothetical protein AK812_SmicGene17041 [Symbiodinium microadriaticum]|uniref:Uncharacterized protein n=1 Tax=Symbiodinium microadriaticum TaxID=2951 RepID=A0A1Q9DYM5_SYMMI|nr:hypothetical protein AK812_SmicGene17041 [Symbiodinium microadriaticum]
MKRSARLVRQGLLLLLLFAAPRCFVDPEKHEMDFPDEFLSGSLVDVPLNATGLSAQLQDVIFTSVEKALPQVDIDLPAGLVLGVEGDDPDELKPRMNLSKAEEERGDRELAGAIVQFFHEFKNAVNLCVLFRSPARAQRARAAWGDFGKARVVGFPSKKTTAMQVGSVAVVQDALMAGDMAEAWGGLDGSGHVLGLYAGASQVSQPDQGPLCGQEVCIVAEMAPTHWVGQEGTVKSYLGGKDDSFVPKPFEPTLAKKLKMLLDQYMSAGWALIYEHFHRKGESFSDVVFVDALLADSLKKDGAPAAAAAEIKALLAELLSLAVMVEALALRRGEGPKHGGSQHSVVAELNAKLPTFSSQLKAEYQKLAEERDAFLLDQAAQLKSGSDKAAKLLGKQAAQAKGELSELQKTAPKFLKEGSPPEVSDLGKEALLDIERVKTLGNPQALQELSQSPDIKMLLVLLNARVRCLPQDCKDIRSEVAIASNPVFHARFVGTDGEAMLYRSMNTPWVLARREGGRELLRSDDEPSLEAVLTAAASS